MRKFTFLLILIVFTCGSLLAQQPYGSEFTGNTTTNFNQRYPDITMDAEGNFVLVWQSYFQPLDENDYGIVAQRFDSLGAKLGGERLVNVSIPEGQQRPAIASDGSGGYWITWMSNSANVNYANDIYLRGFDSELNPMTGQFAVNTWDSLEQMSPDIASNENGEFVVVWESHSIIAGDSTFNIFAQVYDSEGSAVDTNFIVNYTTANQQRFPKVAMNNSGFVVTWQSGSVDTDWDVYAQRFDNVGNSIGVEFMVNDFTDIYQRPTGIDMNSSGRFVIAWRSDSQDGSQDGVYVKQYNANGTQRFAEQQVNQYVAGNQTSAKVDIDDLNNFVVTWQSYGQDGDDYGIYARRYDEDGTPFADEFLVNTLTASAQSDPAIAVQDRGKFVVAWNSWINDTPTRDDIRVQIYKMGPGFTALPDIAMTEDVNKVYPISDYFAYVADEDDADANLTWELSDGTNVSTSDAEGTITITPTNNWFGTDSFMVVVTDPSGLADTTYQVVNVSNVDDDPTVANPIANVTAVEDAANGTIALAAVFDDIDNDNAAIVKTVEGNTNATLVTASISGNTLTLDYQLNQSGIADITVRGTSNGKTVDDVFRVTVSADDDAPTVANPIANVTAVEDAANGTIALATVFTDVDNADASIVKTVEGNTNATLVTASISGNTLTLDYQANQSGIADITVRGTSNGKSVDDVFRVTVSADDDAPAVANPIANVTAVEDAANGTIALATVFTDIDNDDASIVKTVQGNTNATLVTASISGNTLTLDYQLNQSGIADITVRGTSGGQTVDDVFRVTVSADDDAPTVANPIADVSVIEDAANSTIALASVFTDVDNDDASIVKTVQANNNAALVTASISGNTLTLDYQDGQNGTADITIRGTSGGQTVDDVFKVTVGAIDDAPTVANAISDVTVAEDAANSTINLATVFTDQDNDDAAIVKTVQANSNSTLVTASISGNTLTLDYQADQNGTADITIRGTSGGQTVDDVFKVTVTAVDDAPVVANPLSAVSVDEDADDSTIDVTDVFSDVDNEDADIVKTIQNTTNPALVTASIEGNLLTLKFAENMTGKDTITIRGTSNTKTADALLIVTVQTVNDPPVLSQIPEQSFNEDDSLMLAISSLYDLVEDPDNADSTLIFSYLAGTEITATVSDGIITFKAPANWFGTDSGKVVVSDGEYSDTSNVKIVVVSVNDVPIITNVPDSLEFVSTSELIIDMDDYIDDYDFPDDSLALEFSVSDTTVKISFDPETYEVTLTAPPTFWGDVMFYFSATDESAAEVADSILIKVMGDPTSIDNLAGQIPTSYTLGQNYPNPFNPLTHIKFGLPKAGEVSIILYNVLGQEVAKLLDANKSAGFHTLDFDASHLPSGLYFYRIQAENFAEVKKMVLMK